MQKQSNWFKFVQEPVKLLKERFLLIFFITNPFLVNVPILYPLETPENLWVAGVFQGV